MRLVSVEPNDIHPRALKELADVFDELSIILESHGSWVMSPGTR